jgi:hypothetical protein
MVLTMTPIDIDSHYEITAVPRRYNLIRVIAMPGWYLRFLVYRAVHG